VGLVDKSVGVEIGMPTIHGADIMCHSTNLFRASSVLAVAAALLIGCQRRPPNGHWRQRPDSQGMAKKAIAQFDANGNGTIEGRELDSCPGLRAAFERLDPKGSGRVTAKMIAARIDAWFDSHLGRMSIACTVTHNGKPLKGALVKFVPEKFLADFYARTAKGETDSNGQATISVPTSGMADDPRGVPPGFYRVEITKLGENIPATYNTDTILGQEVAMDAVPEGESIRYDLRY
jgi:hypothetical protein